ncbi:MAG: hypothetical protein GWP04_06140 [Gammaproteobacteria bacterium]|nr:hypothetical protein [Gammaproteobacteria bacterium]
MASQRNQGRTADGQLGDRPRCGVDRLVSGVNEGVDYGDRVAPDVRMDDHLLLYPEVRAAGLNDLQRRTDLGHDHGFVVGFVCDIRHLRRSP